MRSRLTVAASAMHSGLHTMKCVPLAGTKQDLRDLLAHLDPLALRDRKANRAHPVLRM